MFVFRNTGSPTSIPKASKASNAKRSMIPRGIRLVVTLYSIKEQSDAERKRNLPERVIKRAVWKDYSRYNGASLRKLRAERGVGVGVGVVGSNPK